MQGGWLSTLDGANEVVAGSVDGIGGGGTDVTSLVTNVAEENGSPEVVAMLTGFGLVALPTRLELTELALASLSEARDESTLRTELVSEKEPVVIVGVVPAKLMVNEVVRPRAPLSAVLTALDVLIAGVTEDSAVVSVGVTPEASWYTSR